MTGEGVKLTRPMLATLSYILERGPGTLPVTMTGKTPARVQQLLDAGYLETLNRIRPGPVMYEITPAGRLALTGRKDDE